MQYKKIIFIIIIFMCTMTLFASLSIVQASALGNSINSAQQFPNNGKINVINYQFVYDAVSFIYNIAMIVAIIVAVIVGLIIGIRTIFGGIDERADSKHLIVPYLVIVAMIAFGFTIWKAVLGIIYNHI